MAAGPVAGSPQRPGELDASTELEGRAGGQLVGGLTFLAGELVDPLVVDHLESVGGVEQAAEVAGKIIVSPPKTDAGRRVVTLPRVAVEALAAHLAEYAEPGPDGLVFTTPKGAYLLRSPFYRFVWRPAVEQGEWR